MSTPPQTSAFAHQAAKLSWACPIIIFLLLVAGKQAISPLILDLLGFLLIVVGLIFGVIALCGISRHGTKGILAPAIVGIVINGLLLFIFVTNFVAARARAQQHTGIGPSPVAGVWSFTAPAHSPKPLSLGFGKHPATRVTGCCYPPS